MHERPEFNSKSNRLDPGAIDKAPSAAEDRSRRCAEARMGWRFRAGAFRDR